MGLKIELKPNERFIISGAVVKNVGPRAELIIENNVPILREKNILSPDKANTPCKRIYLVIQLMYVDEKKLPAYHKTYWELINDVIKAAPSMAPLTDQITEHMLGGRYYQALKVTKRLIDQEERMINHVRSANVGIPEHPEDSHDGSRD